MTRRIILLAIAIIGGIITYGVAAVGALIYWGVVKGQRSKAVKAEIKRLANFT